jgi:hypothetical protein
MSLSSPSPAANTSITTTTTNDGGGGGGGGGGNDVSSLQAALGQVRGENEQLITKFKELLGRHKELQKSAGEWKAQGEEARTCVCVLMMTVTVDGGLVGGRINYH